LSCHCSARSHQPYFFKDFHAALHHNACIITFPV
jgi:hypothetical protein